MNGTSPQDWISILYMILVPNAFLLLKLLLMYEAYVMLTLVNELLRKKEKEKVP